MHNKKNTNEYRPAGMPVSHSAPGKGIWVAPVFYATSALSHRKQVTQVFIPLVIILFWIIPAWASYLTPELTDQTSGPVDSSPTTIFQQHIPVIAEQFIGMPFKMGGRPRRTGSTDNSSLFYTIYTMAAQKAGLTYKAYLPMRYLLKNTLPVEDGDIRNGDLIVLDNDLAAMIYRVDPSGRMHFIYASAKRQEVVSFHSGNLVYQAYWLEHLKGFFRLNKEMLLSAQ